MNYITLCNEVLVDINEVTFATNGSDFTSSRGIQTLVKNTVNRAIREIYASNLNWPFARTAGTQALIPATQIYALPTSLKSVDWESFFIQPIEELTNGTFTSAITSWTNTSAGSGSSAYTSSNNGSARLTGDGTNIGGLSQSVSTVASRVYRVQVRYVNNGVTVKVGTTSGGSEIETNALTLDFAGEGQIDDFTFTATGATTYLALRLLLLQQ